MAIVKLVTKFENADTVVTFESYLSDIEQELLCKFRQVSLRERGEIIGELNGIILNKFRHKGEIQE